jgi:hypothetical protein
MFSHPPSARLKALADVQKGQDIDKLLAHYEKKDAVAQQLEGITKMKVGWLVGWLVGWSVGWWVGGVDSLE